MRRLADGDLVNVDVSAELDGYWADTGASAAVGRSPPRRAGCSGRPGWRKRDAMHAARAGAPLRHIGRPCERRAQARLLASIKNLNGHGTGRRLWEPPSVPGIEDPQRQAAPVGRAGAGDRAVPLDRREQCSRGADGWTLCTPGHLSAQFEHTVVVTAGRPIVLTAAAAA